MAIHIPSETPADFQARVNVGDIVGKRAPYSEVCMHLGIAGKMMAGRILERGFEIHAVEGEAYSTLPITHGEAGFYSDSEGLYYYPAESKV